MRLANDVTGTLPVANGGTGLAALGTALYVLRVNAGATALEFAAASGGASAGSSGQVQTSDGAGGFSAPANVLAGAGYISVGATPATFGSFRFRNGATFGIASKNTAATDVNIAHVTASDGCEVWGTTAAYGHLILNIGSGALILMTSAAVNALTVSAANVMPGVPIVGYTPASSPYGAHGGVLFAFASDADYTVTAAQYSLDYLHFTSGSWTTGRTITLPAPATKAVGYYKTIRNATLYTMTVSTGVGGTASLTTGQTKCLWFDDTGVVSAISSF